MQTLIRTICSTLIDLIIRSLFSRRQLKRDKTSTECMTEGGRESGSLVQGSLAAPESKPMDSGCVNLHDKVS